MGCLVGRVSHLAGICVIVRSDFSGFRQTHRSEQEASPEEPHNFAISVPRFQDPLLSELTTVLSAEDSFLFFAATHWLPQTCVTCNLQGLAGAETRRSLLAARRSRNFCHSQPIPPQPGPSVRKAPTRPSPPSNHKIRTVCLRRSRNLRWHQVPGLRPLRSSHAVESQNSPATSSTHWILSP
jgi:hypothetical protein